MAKIPICPNWLIYWGVCRKFRKHDIADMAYVSHTTINSRFKEMGISYRAQYSLKRRERGKKFNTATSKPPPWELNSHISNFLAQLEEGTSKTDVGGFMKQYREGVRNGKL